MQTRDREFYALVQQVLGASKGGPQIRFAMYFPDKDQDGHLLRDIETWINRAMYLLTEINGGASALPNLKGMWKDAHGMPLNETTVLVYSFIPDLERFYQNLRKLRLFIQRFGKETNQSEVLVEFGDATYWINEFDTEDKD